MDVVRLDALRRLQRNGSLSDEREDEEDGEEAEKREKREERDFLGLVLVVGLGLGLVSRGHGVRVDKTRSAHVSPAQSLYTYILEKEKIRMEDKLVND